MVVILNFGVYIAGGFSVMFIYYTNSFLIKRRKKELGLYSILGMEKKHIGKILFFEVLFSGSISLIIGILSGILFGRLMFALLLNILTLDTNIKFTIPLISIAITLVLFTLTYLAVMKSNREGEREPKANWILAILGLVSLGMGYYLALTVKNPIQSLNIFFIAVILVIIATYFLFTSGSIGLLKILKKNKKFYYNRKHFIPVSNMIYRMKQNAVGLGNICILSTAVLLTLSTTISLYVGFEDILRHRFPSDVRFNYIYEYQDRETILDTVENHSKTHHVTTNNLKEYYSLSVLSHTSANQLIKTEDLDINSLDENDKVAIFIPLSDFNNNTGEKEKLNSERK